MVFPRCNNHFAQSGLHSRDTSVFGDTPTGTGIRRARVPEALSESLDGIAAANNALALYGDGRSCEHSIEGVASSFFERLWGRGVD